MACRWRLIGTLSSRRFASPRQASTRTRRYGTGLWIIAPLDPEAAGHPTDLPEDIAAAVRSGRASRQDERVVPVAANLILLSGGDVAGGQNQIVEAGRRVSNRLLKARATAVGQACLLQSTVDFGQPLRRRLRPGDSLTCCQRHGGAPFDGVRGEGSRVMAVTARTAAAASATSRYICLLY